MAGFRIPYLACKALASCKAAKHIKMQILLACVIPFLQITEMTRNLQRQIRPFSLWMRPLLQELPDFCQCFIVHDNAQVIDAFDQTVLPFGVGR